MAKQASCGWTIPTRPKIILLLVTPFSPYMRYNIISTSNTQKPEECGHEKYIIREQCIHDKDYRQGNHYCGLDASAESVEVREIHISINGNVQVTSTRGIRRDLDYDYTVIAGC